MFSKSSLILYHLETSPSKVMEGSVFFVNSVLLRADGGTISEAIGKVEFEVFWASDAAFLFIFPLYEGPLDRTDIYK